jgi:hypothetical protein
MSDLGPDAIPALDEFLTTAKAAGEENLTSFSILRNELASRVIYNDFGTKDVHAFAQDWREWTWRSERLQQYLLAHPFSPRPAPIID